MNTEWFQGLSQGIASFFVALLLHWGIKTNVYESTRSVNQNLWAILADSISLFVSHKLLSRYFRSHRRVVQNHSLPELLFLLPQCSVRLLLLHLDFSLHLSRLNLRVRIGAP